MTKDAVLLSELTKARDDHALLSIEVYCENSSCSAREVEIRVKDHDDTLIESVRKDGLRCPVCGSRCKLHGVLTARERQLGAEQKARWNVNVQMYRRDKNTTAVPAPVYFDDRLPPTPANWWD